MLVRGDRLGPGAAMARASPLVAQIPRPEGLLIGPRAGQRARRDAGAGSGVPPLLRRSIPPERRVSGFSAGRKVMFALVALLLGAVVGGYALYDQYFKTTWVVDADGGGDTTSIGEAMELALPGSTILIRPGTYRESIVIARPLRLQAADPANPPVLASPSLPCLSIRGDDAAVIGLDVRAPPNRMDRGPADRGPKEAGTSCVLVGGGAPLLQGNRFSGGNGPMIMIRDGSEATLRGNTVADVAGSALLVGKAAVASVAANSFTRTGGVIFAEGALGRFVDNRLVGTTGTAIQIAAGAAPAIIGNFIAGAGGHGILALAASDGRIANNTVQGSKGNGIVISEGTKTTVESNVLEENAAPQLVDQRRH